MKYALANSLSSAVSGLDPDAKAYIAAVEAADAQALESGVKVAINNFVKGCKSDAIWNAIKASCILAGARTLSGALVPLRGTAPTNFNFVSGDYNRKTGLLGNGTTKYLDSNRNNNTDPQNSNHNSVYASVAALGIAIGSSITATGSNSIGATVSRNRSGTSDSALISNGFNGTSRSASASYIHRSSGSSATITRTSETPDSGDVTVFRATTSFGTHRLSFYSIGESLDLALLDSRVSTLMTSINSAIP